MGNVNKNHMSIDLEAEAVSWCGKQPIQGDFTKIHFQDG